MRITFVCPPPDFSGGIRVVAIYAQRLLRRGHQVTVVYPPRLPATFWQRTKHFAKGHGWPQAAASGSHFDGCDFECRPLDRYRPLTDADVPDADAIVATWWETAEWIAPLAARKGAKVYFLQHHEVFDYLPRERVEATWRLPLHKITISRWLVDLAANHYGDGDVTFVPNSVDGAQFFAPPRGKQSRPTVGMLYSTIYWKGCAVSLAALARAARELPSLRLVAFGTEPISPELPLPAGAEYYVQPPQATLRELYAACDVWLCGSWSEGFHLPPLEAMACGCPVVSTAVGGPLDIVQDGVNGHLVPLGDAQQLAERLRQVVTAPEADWRRLSAAAHHTAAAYTWDDAAERFEAGLERARESGGKAEGGRREAER